MNKSLIATALTTALSMVLLSGCASKEERKIASGTIDYVKLPVISTTKVPSELTQPTVAVDFQIPAIGKDAVDIYGKQLPVASPALVLPLAHGTYLTEDLTNTSVIFDKLDSPLTIEQLILGQIDNQLSRLQIDYSMPDPAQQRYVTDWIMTYSENDAKWYEISAGATEVGKRFELIITPATHGRSATLTVNLLDLVVDNAGQVTDTINPFAKRDYEAELLNGIIQQYSIVQQQQNDERIAQIRSGITSELGFDDNGNAAIILDTRYDITWPKFQLVLRKLGFNVKDLDKSTGLIFVNYQGLDESWFKGLFGSSQELPLKKSDYRITIKKLTANKSTVTFMDDQSIPLTPSIVSQLYPAFEDVLGQNDLDI